MADARVKRRPTGWPAVVAFLLAAACEAAPPQEDRAEIRDRIVSAVVEFEVGELDGAPEYTFGAIRDIAVDHEGRVFLADGPYFQVRVMDADGRALFTFGRRGDGPGDLLQPRRLGFDREGRLWVYNTTETSGARYDAFSLEGESAHHLFRLRPQEWRSGRAGPIAFDREGRLIHPTTPGSNLVSADRMNPSPMVRLHLDTAGQVRDSVSIRSVSRDSLGFLPVEIPAPQVEAIGGPSTMVFPIALPGAAEHRIAHSPADGAYAEAVTSLYQIHWHDDRGALLRVLTRPVSHGPPFSPAEQEAMVERWARQATSSRESGGTVLPRTVPMPEHKHPIDQLFFDMDGRLWVQRTAAEADTLVSADVFDPDGDYAFTVRWPRRVALSPSAIRGDRAYGITRDELDIQRFVRLRIERPPD